MSKIIFLTGATGLVGSYLLKLLVENGYFVYVLTRSKTDKTAEKRVLDILEFWNEEPLPACKRKQLKIIEGDITFPNLGISQRDREELASETEIIYHSAALAELALPLEKIRKINVEGTRNVLDFALKCRAGGKFEKVNHISTAYVVGTKNIEFSEGMLELGQGFNNTYEQSKYEAELLVKEYLKKDLSVSVFRPSMIMGHSKSGKTTSFRLFYHPLHFFSKKIYTRFPANPSCIQNLINVDTVAKAMLLLGEEQEPAVYHLSSPTDTSISWCFNLAAEYFGFKIPEFVSIENFDFSKWTPAQKLLANSYIPYFNYNAIFLSKETRKKLKKYYFNYPEINQPNLFKSFDFCCKKKFIQGKV